MIIRRFFAAILLIGLTAYYFAEALFFNGVLSFRDLSRYFYPLRYFNAECVKNFILPLWNPYIFCGTPHLALQQSVVFYPLSVIYYIFPFDKAFNLFLVIHIFLAGIFTFFLCRRWRLGEAASLLSAVTFMFSGYIISVINLATTLSSVIWLPVILLFFDKALVDTKPKYILLAAAFLGIMFLGGEPSIFYSTLWVLLFYSVFFCLNNKSVRVFKITAICYISVAAAASLLSAVQLLPFLELMNLADRAIARLPYGELTKWSLPLKDTFSFIIPFLARTDFSKDSYWKEQNWVILIYVGVLALLLVIMACVFKKSWRTNFLIFIGLLFLLISYGSSIPFYYFVYKFIPGFNYVRYPVRFLYVTTFAVSVMCGVGFNAYIERRGSADEKMRRFFKYLLTALYVFAIIFLALHIYRDGLIEMARGSFVKYIDPKAEGQVLFSIISAIVNVKRFLGFLIAGGMVLYLGSKIKIRQGFLSFAFISIVIADLFSAMPECRIMLDSKIFSEATPNTGYMNKDPHLSRFFVAPPTREANNFLKGKTYEDGIRAIKDTLAANWPMRYGLYDISGYDSIRLARNSKVLLLLDTVQSPSDTRIFDMLNMKYLVSLDGIKAKGYKFVNKGVANLYENVNVLPRAYLVDSFKVYKKEVDIANRFKSKEFDPAKEVILEEEPLLAYSVERIAYSVKEKVEITRYMPNEVIIKATVNAPKFLVLSDTYYPGWKVYVDGRRDKVYVADYILRAVYLAPGDHDVRFVFDPFSFKLGLSLSIITLAGILFILLV